MIDVAGGGVVHVLGGTAALVSAYIVGPRTGCPPHAEAASPRTSDGSPKAFSRGYYPAGVTPKTSIFPPPPPPLPPSGLWLYMMDADAYERTERRNL